MPVASAVGSGGSVFLPYDHEVIESAPEVQPGNQLDEGALTAAAEHYKLKRPR